MTTGAIASILTSIAPAAECASAAEWWPRWRSIASAWRSPFERSVAGGADADRIGWAFASGYQAALRVLDPSLADDVVAALCVTEADGNFPRAIRTTLTPVGAALRLSGEKRWTTLGPEGGLFLIIAREAGSDEKRPALKAIRVASGTPGLAIEAMPPTSFVPEVPHARIRLTDVRVEASAVLEGDAYSGQVKPFRTIEDIHVNAAIIAYLMREAVVRKWPRGWMESALALLHALDAIAKLDPLAPATHIALGGALAGAAALHAEADAHWAAAGDDPAALRWARDRKLTSVAGKARAQRLAAAWDRLDAQPQTT